jgi:hypothetical protein
MAVFKVVTRQRFTDVSKMPVASIITAKMMQTASTSETSVNF